MSDVVISTTARDAEAVEAARSHHAEIAGGLAARVSALTAAARAANPTDEARQELVRWCRSELLPHAYAEESALYPAGRALPDARMLVEAMIVEHQLLSDLVQQLDHARDAVVAASTAVALRTLFDAHVTKENEQLLPALAASADVSLSDLLHKMHGALVRDEAAGTSEESAHGGGDCTCGEHDAAGDPELDARAVPHAIRHATIFGALDAVRPGRGLVLVAPHDPLPMLAQLDRRSPGAFDISYLERGPEAWRLRLVRRTTP